MYKVLYREIYAHACARARYVEETHSNPWRKKAFEPCGIRTLEGFKNGESKTEQAGTGNAH